MFLAMGLLAGLLRAKTTGEGRVIDAATGDGSACDGMFAISKMGLWRDQRGSTFSNCRASSNLMNVRMNTSALVVEPQFYAALMENGPVEDTEFVR